VLLRDAQERPDEMGTSSPRAINKNVRLSHRTAKKQSIVARQQVPNIESHEA
jgi:hypothetical protein